MGSPPPRWEDSLCCVCRSLLVDPVTLPCGHSFCLACTDGWRRAATFSCPLCRRRVQAWLRRATKRRQLVDEALARRLEAAFGPQLAQRRQGREPEPPEPSEQRNVSAPGEIRREYEAQLQELRRERGRAERRDREEAERLARELEETRQKSETEALKSDEEFARKLSTTLNDDSEASKSTPKRKNGYKTLDCYFRKPNESQKSGPSVSASPEVISAHYCGKSNGKSTGSAKRVVKVDPKVWDPHPPSRGHVRELSVCSGIVTSKNTNVKAPAKLAVSNSEVKSDKRSEDSLIQDLCYFKPIHTAPIDRYRGKIVKCLAVKITDMPILARTLNKNGSPNKVIEPMSLNFVGNSAFVRFYKLTECVNMNGTNVSPIKKTSKRKAKCSPRSTRKSAIDSNNHKTVQSCSKLNFDERKKITKGLKRSLSFDNESGKSLTNGKNGLDHNHRTLRSNKVHFVNGNAKVKIVENGDLHIEDIDPSVIEEQKRIEKMILQEKKDLMLAKKLQRQSGDNYIFTSTVKRQAKLTDLMRSPKKMKT